MPIRGPRVSQLLPSPLALAIPVVCHLAEQPFSSDGPRAPGAPLSRASEGLRASRPRNSRLRTARASLEELAGVPHRLGEAARPSAGGTPLPVRGTQKTTRSGPVCISLPDRRSERQAQLGAVERSPSTRMPASLLAMLRRRPESRPNPSLEATLHGLALGPRGARWHHPPRGPSANPRRSPQLKR